MGRALIMRLMHLGLDAFLVGDINTSGLNKADLLLVFGLLVLELMKRASKNAQDMLTWHTNLE